MENLQNIEEENLDALYKTVGFVVIQWGQAEQSLDLAVNTLFQACGGHALAKKMPKMLETKIKFVRDCLVSMDKLKPLKDLGENLLKEFEELKPRRDELIHGAISSLEVVDGKAHFLKLETRKDHHQYREFQFDLNEFPEFSGRLVELGAKSVKFATQLWAQHGKSHYEP